MSLQEYLLFVNIIFSTVDCYCTLKPSKLLQISVEGMIIRKSETFLVTCPFCM